MRHRAAPWRPGPRARRAATLLTAAAGIGAIAVGGVLAVRPPQVAAADAGTVPSVTMAAPAAVPVVTESWQAARVPVPELTPDPAEEPGHPPAVLRSSDAGVAADIVPVGVQPSGALDVPEDPAVLGWWSSGAAAGASSGSVVLAGHVDSARGAGVLQAFLDVPMGATVDLVDETGAATTYQIVARRSFGKGDGLPRELFTIDGAPQLVLITCGGTFDAGSGHYSDNVVVYAVVA